MESCSYLYSLNYPEFEKELCALEVKSLFNDVMDDKVFFANTKVDPSVSPFLRNRLEVLFSHSSFTELVALVDQGGLHATDYMVRYVKLYDQDPPFQTRRSYCKQLGYKIHGEPLYISPKEVFGITLYKGMWYFGILKQNDITWKEHKDKPYSYSSSIGITIAKVLVNIAGNGDLSKRIVDPCCGVGTVLIEGVYAGYAMKGWEINRKIAEASRGNLKYFNYNVPVITGDIKDIEEAFDASIIDLPYGNFSITTQDELQSILKNAKRISKKMVIVSAKDISNEIKNENLIILDRCEVVKNKHNDFTRYVWVCE
ncbi:MAG: SAM-dependent methyltransferase [Peptostreptococcaceae bacterium]|nr:SAM-dependent methyltransferase [Peptostreptococcaceae bacterium]